MSEQVVRAQGAEVPKLGFGTWQIHGDECVEAVRDALELGYRHVDTARAYDNERFVARGLADSGVAREEVWLTTKVWMDDLTRDRLHASVENSLLDLRTDYLDLLLIHWPSASVPLTETLTEMVRLRDLGRIRHLGVSNFPAGMLERALELAPILCDQVEHHPMLGQDRILKVAEEHDLVVGAYAPFAHGEIHGDPVLAEIGEAHGKSAGQVALRWLMDEDRVVAIPKAASHENRVANLDIFDFELSAEERGRIDALPKDRRHFDTSWAPDWND
ncbi:MAG TPA: aldo/keto reductase [Solirubrobacterales bacterium]